MKFLLLVLATHHANAYALQSSRGMMTKALRPAALHAAPIMSIATTVAPAVGAVLTNGMFLAGVPAVQAARDKGSLGALNPLPFAMVLVNCVAWTSYGMLGGDPFVVVGNLPGVFVGFWMYTTAQKVGTAEQRQQLVRVVQGMSAVFAGCAYAIVLGPLAGDAPSQLHLALGVANGLSLCFYASPLTALRDVLRTRCSAPLCGPMSAVALANCGVWVYYGVAIDEPGLVAPNLVGALLSVAQLLLLLFFSSKGASVPREVSLRNYVPVRKARIFARRELKKRNVEY